MTSSITVVIPTYRRSDDLKRCLTALQQQIRAVDEAIVVIRDTDSETWLALKSWAFQPLPLRTVTVAVPGVVAAMNAGLNAATGDIIAFTDDDAAPHADWLQRIETWLESDDRLGAIGGRDWQYRGTQLKETGAEQVVGQVQWFGRMVGNHHLAVGEPQEVDVLKGVNMALRRSAIAHFQFDERMHGTGAQVHFELAFILALKRAGWKVIFDPSVAVDHYPAERFDEDQRDQFNPLAWTNAVHNSTLALLDHFPPYQQVVFLLWAMLIGTRDAFGLLQWCRFFPTERDFAGRKLQASLKGRWQGWQTWRQKPTQSSPQNYPLTQREVQ